MFLTKQKLINHIAHLDRELGYLFFLKLFKILQPRYEIEEWEISSDREVSYFFPEILTKKNVTLKYHKTFFESYKFIVSNKTIIDSATGWVYFLKFVPLHYSFPYALHPWKSYLKPTFFWCQMKNLFKTPNQSFDEAINLIWYGWENYYHFLTDIVPILIHIRESELNKLPVLVPLEKFKKKFVQDFLRLTPELAELNFQLIHGKNIVKVQNKLVLIKISKFNYPISFFLKQHKYFKQFRELPNINVTKVFLYRSIQSKRSLLNNQQIVGTLSNKGYLCIDTSNFDLEKQVSIFKNVAVCVAIHGAGIINLIFSQKIFTLIELNASNVYFPDHYRLFTQQAGGRYYRLLGGKPNENFQFSIDSKKLLSVLNEIDQ